MHAYNSVLSLQQPSKGADSCKNNQLDAAFDVFDASYSSTVDGLSSLEDLFDVSVLEEEISVHSKIPVKLEL